MLITVFGATGRVGSRCVQMALAKGYKVRAFGRDITKWIDKDLRDENFEAIKGYVFDEQEVFDAIRGCNVVLSALGGAINGEDKTRSLGIKNIITQMQQAGIKRIITVGSQGILNDDKYEYRMKNPGYPAVFRAVSEEHFEAYTYLRNSGLDWTIVCPPEILNSDATGEYTVSVDYPPVPNRMKVAAGDIALCMLNEITENKYLYKRIGISMK